MTQQGQSIALGLPIGIGAGVALGVALGNLPVGLALGAGIGLSIGLAMEREQSGTEPISPRAVTVLTISALLGLVILVGLVVGILLLR